MLDSKAAILEQLSNTVLAAQIASLTTLAAEFNIESHVKRQQQQQQLSSDENVQTIGIDLVRLINLSVRILIILRYLETKANFCRR